ncbi:TIGR03089 family protein [Propionibacteriaceae bacterium Y1923]|uniref:TIGR03089 family protein n=1 Tax=Aestuariimicrobium sp. Y1814 TaxID=3418742 RepID=UPI003C1884CF
MQLRAPSPSSRPPASVGHWLEQRLKDDPGRPLVVWYGPADERVELSAATFSNWVDKTINLVDDLGWADAPVVAAPLLLERPGHWASLVWAAAVWSCGGELRALGASQSAAVDLAVVGPRAPRPVPGVDTIACSLHPLGLGFEALAPGMLDYHDVLGQPDLHTPAQRPDSDDVAWQDATATLTHGDLLAGVEPVTGRVLVDVGPEPDALAVLRQALLGPLLGHGSAVIVETAAGSGTGSTAGAERVQRIAAAEKAALG